MSIQLMHIPVEILHQIIILLDDPSPFLRSSRAMHALGSDSKIKSTWIIQKANTIFGSRSLSYCFYIGIKTKLMEDRVMRFLKKFRVVAPSLERWPVGSSKDTMISVIEIELGKWGNLNALCIACEYSLIFDLENVIRTLWGHGHVITTLQFIKWLAHSSLSHNALSLPPCISRSLDSVTLELLIRKRKISPASLAVNHPTRFVDTASEKMIPYHLPFILKTAVIKKDSVLLQRFIDSKFFSTESGQQMGRLALEFSKRLGHSKVYKQLRKVIA